MSFRVFFPCPLCGKELNWGCEDGFACRFVHCSKCYIEVLLVTQPEYCKKCKLRVECLEVVTFISDKYPTRPIKDRVLEVMSRV